MPKKKTTKATKGRWGGIDEFLSWKDIICYKTKNWLDTDLQQDQKLIKKDSIRLDKPTWETNRN